jgi:hypothetical protein
MEYTPNNVHNNQSSKLATHRASSSTGYVAKKDFSAYNYPPGIFGPVPQTLKFSNKVGKVYNGLIVDLREQQQWAGSGNMTSKHRWTSPNGGGAMVSSRHSSNIRMQRRQSEIDKD